METINIKISPIKDLEKRKKLQFKAGDTVKVFQKIQEKGKTRLQAFEGLVLARKHGAEPGATFTVRRIASGVGVEKIFPLYSPVIDKIEVVKKSKVRRSKLYYIRDKAAKEIRKKLKFMRQESAQEPEEEIEEMEEEKMVETSEVSQEQGEQTGESKDKEEVPTEDKKEEK